MSATVSGCCCLQMACRLELRTNYLRHRKRLEHPSTGRFSLDRPKSFPMRSREVLFAGNCYEKPLTSFDAEDPTRAPPPRVVRERPGWDDSLVVTHGLDGHRPRSAANPRRRQDVSRPGRASDRDRPSSAGQSTFGVSSLEPHVGWSAQDSMAYETPPIDALPGASPAKSTAAPARDPNWSVDLTPEQAKAFVDFVTLLTDVEGAGGMSMVHLAQAAVDQATAQRRRSGAIADNSGMKAA